MTFPTIPTVGANRVFNANNVSPTTTLTSPNLSSVTKNAGDLLIAIAYLYQSTATANAVFSSWGGGFTEFLDSSSSTTMAIGAAYKFSTGSETGTFTVAIASTVTGDGAVIVLSIPDAHPSAAPEAGGRADGTNAAQADATSLSPSWGAADTLWIAVSGDGETSTAGAYNGISAGPSGYGDLFTGTISADKVGGIQSGVAFLQSNAASEDPGAWTADTSNARHAALTIAVRPWPDRFDRLVVAPSRAVHRSYNW